MSYYTLYRLMAPFQERAAARARAAMRPFLEEAGRRLAEGRPAGGNPAGGSTVDGGPAGAKPLSGTFICHRPPDYEGKRAEDWSAADWEAEFLRLKSLGIGTVIHQGALGETIRGELTLWYEPEEATLKSLATAARRLGRRIEVRPGLDALLEAAGRTGMEVHLGLYNVVQGWFGLPGRTFLATVLDEELSVAEDLATRYAEHPALAGWYVSPEILYGLHGKRRDLDMAAFLRSLVAPLRAATPGKRIGISPGSFWKPGAMDEVEDFWTRTFRDSGLTTLYPQDSVGVLAVRPEDAPALWESWARVARASGLELWANCESFERAHFTGPSLLDAAPFPRFLAQLEAASPHVDRVVTWEAMHFLDPEGAPGAAALESAYRGHFGLPLGR